MELFRSTQLFMPSSSETRVQKCLHKLKGTRCWTDIFGLPTGRPLHSYLSLLTKSKLLSRLERSVPCFYPSCKYGESEWVYEKSVGVKPPSEIDAPKTRRRCD